MLKKFVYDSKNLITYNDFGRENGFPIIIEHGSTGSIKDVDIFEDLGNYARIIYIARPGYGESTPYNLSNFLEYGNIIKKLVNILNINSFDVLGHSAGAPYAYSIGMVCKVKNRNIYIYSGTPALYDIEVQKYLPALPFSIKKQLTIEESQKIAYEMTFSNLSEEDFKKDSIKDSMANNCYGEAQNLRIWFKDWGFKLQDIQSSVYIQHGKKDEYIPYQMVQRTAKLFQNCKLELLDDGTHFNEEKYKSFIQETIIKKLKKQKTSA